VFQRGRCDERVWESHAGLVALHNSQPDSEVAEHTPVPRWGWGEAPPYQTLNGRPATYTVRLKSHRWLDRADQGGNGRSRRQSSRWTIWSPAGFPLDTRRLTM
jgi:hypothetical protein